jgi:tetratricopeptide (TPR) repeat protein
LYCIFVIGKPVMDIRRPFPVLAVLAVLALTARPVPAQQQEYSATSDPVIRAAVEAQRDQRFADAEKIMAEAVAAAEPTAPNPQLGFYLEGLASLYNRKGDRAQALNLAQRAVENDRSLYGATDIRLAPRAAFLAGLLRIPQRTEEAERFFQQAVELVRQAPNRDLLPVDTRAGLLSNVASFYEAAGRLAEATTLYEDAVKICANLRLAPLCNRARLHLADMYRRQGRLAEAGQVPAAMLPPELMRIDQQASESMRNGLFFQAEIGYKGAIQWIEDHPSGVEGTLPGEWIALGQALEAQGRADPAEDAYKKSLEIQGAQVDRKLPGALDAFVGLSPLVDLYRRQGRLSEMEPVIQRTLSIQEGALGPDHAYLADTLMQLATVYEEEAKTDAARYSDAFSLYERVLKIQEQSYGPDSQQLTRALTGYANVLRAAHQTAKAVEIQSRLDAIRNK